MSKPKPKNIIDVEASIKIFNEKYQLKVKELNHFTLRLTNKSMYGAFYDWFHTTGTLVYNGQGKITKQVLKDVNMVGEVVNATANHKPAPIKSEKQMFYDTIMDLFNDTDYLEKKDIVELARVAIGKYEGDSIRDWYVWSNEHNAWWKPNHNGYTQVQEEAGLYSFSEAFKICESANFQLGRYTEIPNETMLKMPRISDRNAI